MTLELSHIWNLALTGLIAPLAWFLRGSIEDGKKTAEAVGVLRVELHRDFATKKHVEDGLTRIEGRFDRLEEKLDRIMEKHA